jgi:two-component system chemotaxis response regulator CheB
MPPTFTAAFAQRLDSICAIEVAEARNGDEVRQGRALIAPGDHHIVVAKRGGGLQVQITQTERVNYHRPSVEVMFDSITRVRGLPNDTLAVMLTGMGRDGSEAMLRLKEAGANTICQDQESAVVWGMAGEAVKLGAADRVASIHRIAPLIAEMVCREVSHSVS